jgi:hypothetical protein
MENRSPSVIASTTDICGIAAEITRDFAEKFSGFREFSDFLAFTSSTMSDLSSIRVDRLVRAILIAMVAPPSRGWLVNITWSTERDRYRIELVSPKADHVIVQVVRFEDGQIDHLLCPGTLQGPFHTAWQQLKQVFQESVPAGSLVAAPGCVEVEVFHESLWDMHPASPAAEFLHRRISRSEDLNNVILKSYEAMVVTAQEASAAAAAAAASNREAHHQDCGRSQQEDAQESRSALCSDALCDGVQTPSLEEVRQDFSNDTESLHDQDVHWGKERPAFDVSLDSGDFLDFILRNGGVEDSMEDV